MLTVQNLAEAADGLRYRHILAFKARKLLCHAERLRQEVLDLTGTRYRQLILIGKLIHTQNSDDILQILVLLQNRLHRTRNLIMLDADYIRRQDTRGGVQRIHRRINTHRRNITRQNDLCIQMREGSCRRRVGQVIRRHVNRLYGSDRTLFGRGDALLQSAHLGRQRRLITYGARHTAEQRGNLGTRLRETEDIIDEQQHVLPFHIAEVLRHSKTAQRHAHTRAGRLIHLTVNQRRLVDNAGFLHLVIQVIAFTGAFTNAGKYRNTAVLLGNVIDQLHDNDRLADACAAKQADFTALGIRGDQVNDLDAGLKDLGCGFLLLIRGRGTMDRPALLPLDRRLIIHRLTEQVENTAQILIAYRHRDRSAGIDRLHTAHQAIRRFHRNAAHGILTDVLRNLDRDHAAAVVDRDGIEQLGQCVSSKFNVQHRSNDLDNGANILLTHWQNS